MKHTGAVDSKLKSKVRILVRELAKFLLNGIGLCQKKFWIRIKFNQRWYKESSEENSFYNKLESLEHKTQNKIDGEVMVRKEYSIVM